jgi:hypothetical protein
MFIFSSQCETRAAKFGWVGSSSHSKQMPSGRTAGDFTTLGPQSGAAENGERLDALWCVVCACRG